MDNKELLKRQKEVLNKIYEAYQDEDIVAAMAPGEEVGSKDMLLVQHTEIGKEIDEILGAYYFVPAPEELGPFQYFFTTLTLSEEIPEETRESMAAAVTLINSLMPFGTFVISSDFSVISYRHAMLLPNDVDESTLSLTVNATMINALSEVTIWADELDALEYERISYEEFAKFCEEFRKKIDPAF